MSLKCASFRIQEQRIFFKTGSLQFCEAARVHTVNNSCTSPTQCETCLKKKSKMLHRVYPEINVTVIWGNTCKQEECYP